MYRPLTKKQRSAKINNMKPGEIDRFAEAEFSSRISPARAELHRWNPGVMSGQKPKEPISPRSRLSALRGLNILWGDFKGFFSAALEAAYPAARGRPLALPFLSYSKEDK